MCDPRDVADAAAVVLQKPSAQNAAYDLTGPAALTFSEVAAQFTEILGRPISYVPVDEATLRKAYATAACPTGCPISCSASTGRCKLALTRGRRTRSRSSRGRRREASTTSSGTMQPRTLAAKAEPADSRTIEVRDCAKVKATRDAANRGRRWGERLQPWSQRS